MAEEGYNPPPEFKEDTKESLLDLTPSDSTEFWLIQLPKNLKTDFNGQELTLKLHNDGSIGSFSSSGKEYDVVSFASQQPNATVFVSSASNTKIVGKISRRVSFVHYSEPEEIAQHGANNLKKMYQQTSTMSLTSSSHKIGTPLSSRKRHLQSSSGRPASTHSNTRKSSLSDVGEPLKGPSKRNLPNPGRSVDRSSQSSGQVRSGVTSGSSEQSNQGKAKKIKKSEN